MQVVVLVTVTLGIACRGVSVLFVPFDLAFEVLRCSDVICIAITVLTISYTLVLGPTYDSRLTDRAMEISPDFYFGAAWVDTIDAVDSSEEADEIGPDLLLLPQNISIEEGQALTTAAASDQIHVESRMGGQEEQETLISPQTRSLPIEGRDLNDTEDPGRQYTPLR